MLCSIDRKGIDKRLVSIYIKKIDRTDQHPISNYLDSLILETRIKRLLQKNKVNSKTKRFIGRI